MEITLRKENTVNVISAQGRMDAVSAPDFDNFLEKLLSTGETNFIIDCKNLEYISSAGLQSILKAAKKLETTGGRILLCNLQGAVKDVFEISGFDSIFEIYDSPEAALEHFNGERP
ncbi:MAG: STAS domain-containing protein [Syntrophales bacterium]